MTSTHHQLGQRAARLAVAVVLGALFAWAYMLYVRQRQPLPTLDLAISALYLAAFFAAAVYLGLFWFALPRLQALTRRMALATLAAALALAAPLGGLLHAALDRPLVAHTLEVRATGQRNPASKGSELWFGGLLRADGSQLPVAALSLQGAWEIVEGVPVSRAAQPATLRWQGQLAGDARVKLVAHPWSGVAEIVWDGQTQTVDLYADPATERVLTLAAASGTTTRPASTGALLVVANWLCMALLLLVAASLLTLVWRRPGLPAVAAQQPAQTAMRFSAPRRDWRSRLPRVAATRKLRFFIAARAALALALAGGAWLALKATSVPDDRLDVRLSAEAPQQAAGEIRWGDQGSPRTGWPLDLTAIKYPVSDVRVEIQPLVGDKQALQRGGSEVWVYDVATDVVPKLDWQRATYDPTWVRDAAGTPSGYAIKTFGSAPGAFVYQTQARNWINIPFLHHPWSGKAKVTLNGQERIVDLYQGPDNVGQALVFIDALPYTLERVGVLPMPLPQNAGHFQVSFAEQVTRVRLYGIERSGRTSWAWRPGMPVRVGAGNQITTTETYVEAQASPGHSLLLSFDALPVRPYYLPDALDLLWIAAVCAVIFALLVWYGAIWRLVRPILDGLYHTLSPPPAEAPLGRTRWVILAAALMLRLKYVLEDPPMVFGGDSLDYLRVGFWIKHGFNYSLGSADRLDFRGPGYPAFLATTFSLLGTSYTSIIIAQLCLSLLTVYGGMRLGELLGERAVGLAVGGFLALAPDHIFFEHAVMTEVLSVACVVWCCVLGLQYLRHPSRLRYGLLLSLCSALALYTRPNLAPVVGFWLALVLLVVAWPLFQRRPEVKRLVFQWLLVVALIPALLSPWIIRNGLVFGQYSPLPSVWRGRLIFWVDPGLTNFSTPRMAQIASTYNATIGNWPWVYFMGRTRAEGELLAHALWNEQNAYGHAVYVDRAVYGFGTLLGKLPGGIIQGNPRSDVTFVPRSFGPGENTLVAGTETLSFVPYGEYGPAMKLLGWLWPRVFEPLAFPLALLAIAIAAVWSLWLLRSYTARSSAGAADERFAPVIVLGLVFVWLATLVVLALNIAVGARYSMPIDWILIAAATLAAKQAWRAVVQPRLHPASLKSQS